MPEPQTLVQRATMVGLATRIALYSDSTDRALSQNFKMTRQMRDIMSLVQTLRSLVPETMRPGAMIRERVARTTHGRVHTGPFRGMAFDTQSVFGAHTPKLLGTYEKELHPWVELVAQLDLGLIVDVGAAEGYYAIGFATRMPEVQIHAFELQERAHPLMRELARANGVEDRLELSGGCDTETLGAALEGHERALVFCDVEGYEGELLDPEKIPALERAHLLIEIHDHKVAGVGPLLRKRFAKTHRVCEIPQYERTMSDLTVSDPLLTRMPPLTLRYALNEFRSRHIYWFWMEPHA